MLSWRNWVSSGLPLLFVDFVVNFTDFHLHFTALLFLIIYEHARSAELANISMHSLLLCQKSKEKWWNRLEKIMAELGSNNQHHRVLHYSHSVGTTLPISSSMIPTHQSSGMPTSILYPADRNIPPPRAAPILCAMNPHLNVSPLMLPMLTVKQPQPSNSPGVFVPANIPSYIQHFDHLMPPHAGSGPGPGTISPALLSAVEQTMSQQADGPVALAAGQSGTGVPMKGMNVVKSKFRTQNF